MRVPSMVKLSMDAREVLLGRAPFLPVLPVDSWLGMVMAWAFRAAPAVRVEAMRLRAARRELCSALARTTVLTATRVCTRAWVAYREDVSGIRWKSAASGNGLMAGLRLLGAGVDERDCTSPPEEQEACECAKVGQRLKHGA